MFPYKRKFQQYWFNSDTIHSDTPSPYINERALRARAGLLLLIPVILLVIRLEHGNHDEMIVTAEGLTVAKEYSHILVRLLIFFIMYEMITPMFVKTAHLSVSSMLGAFLTRKQQPIYQALRPKIFAWSIGLTLATICQISISYTALQSITLYFLSTCLLFMWLETAFGICAGCYVYHLLARVGIVKESCDTCSVAQYGQYTEQGTSASL